MELFCCPLHVCRHRKRTKSVAMGRWNATLHVRSRTALQLHWLVLSVLDLAQACATAPCEIKREHFCGRGCSRVGACNLLCVQIRLVASRHGLASIVGTGVTGRVLRSRQEDPVYWSWWCVDPQASSAIHHVRIAIGKDSRSWNPYMRSERHARLSFLYTRSSRAKKYGVIWKFCVRKASASHHIKGHVRALSTARASGNKGRVWMARIRPAGTEPVRRSGRRSTTLASATVGGWTTLRMPIERGIPPRARSSHLPMAFFLLCEYNLSAVVRSFIGNGAPKIAIRRMWDRMKLTHEPSSVQMPVYNNILELSGTRPPKVKLSNTPE